MRNFISKKKDEMFQHVPTQMGEHSCKFTELSLETKKRELLEEC